jgi:UDP-N-acetylmuramoyl-tripeptide--D-alanyl-D-alanine ligase
MFEIFYETSGVCTDTRQIIKDSLFICLKGQNFNGNSFAYKALEQGAKYVITDEIEFSKHDNCILVDDALSYLQQLANYHRKKFNIPVIGITGSNGKTTTKELINEVLNKKYRTLCTIGNLNNHIGVPMTLLNLNNTHEIAIIEMGANKLKDIHELCQIAEPTHGIITNIGKAHLEGFIDFNGVLKTKKELYDSIKKNKGVLFYNQDDEVLTSILPTNTNNISFSNKFQGTINGTLEKMDPFVNMSWEKEGYKSPICKTQMIGKYNYYNFLAAICIGNYFNVSEEDINNAISNYSPINNRSQTYKTKTNTLILDAYNANPSSMKNALESFKEIENKHKICILGDMFELGNEAPKEHQIVIETCVTNNLHAIFIGENYASFSRKYTNYTFYKTKNDFINNLQKYPITNSLLLLKASRGIGLESIIEYL